MLTKEGKKELTKFAKSVSNGDSGGGFDNGTNFE